MSKLYQRKGTFKISLLLTLLAMPPRLAFAAADLSQLLTLLYQILLPAFVIIGLALIIINGYGIMTSEGDPRKTQSSKENLTSAIIGLVFVLMAVVIYRIVLNSFIGVSP